ncbi:MAG: ComEC/Rec2 family competence protein, partial [Ruminococcaceae bacterium]|nr:ComEC/Rec2 family competence protein [Oscillospiraceae bacterium]
ERNRTVIAALLCAVTACGMYSLTYAARVFPAHMLEGREVVISGRVTDVSADIYGRSYYVIETDEVHTHGAPQRVKIRLSSDNALAAGISDRIRTVAAIDRISERELSERLSLLSGGIALTARIPFGEQPEITPGSGLLRLRAWFARLREATADAIYECFTDETAAVLCGMLTGDKSGMTAETAEWFRLCGISHLLAVSGMHLSIIIFMLHALLGLVRGLNMYLRLSLEAAAILWCMAFIGFTPSITRAGLMLLIAYGAQLLQRDSDALSSLFVSVLLICLFNPFAAADAGLLLSFSATLGLILLNEPLLRAVKRRVPIARKGGGRMIAETLVSSVSASVFTFPVTVLYFGEVSLLAPLANVLSVLPATALLTVGAVTALLWQIPVAGQIICLAPRAVLIMLTRLWLYMIKMLASLPNAGIPMNYSFLPVFFLCAGVLLAAWYVLWRREAKRKTALLLCAAIIAQLFIFGLSWDRIIKGKEQYVSVYAVEDGMLIAACCEGRCAAVGAGGNAYSSRRAISGLKQSGFTRAEVLVLPCTDQYDAACAEEAVRLLKPKAVFADPNGTQSDAVAYAAQQSGAVLYEVGGAGFFQPDSGLEICVYDDEKGARWTMIWCGELSVLVCPEAGDCSLLPDEFRSPDCAILPGGKLTDTGALNAVAVIVSADGEEGVRAENVLRYRGAENVYSTGKDGSLRIYKESDMVMIGGAE